MFGRSSKHASTIDIGGIRTSFETGTAAADNYRRAALSRPSYVPFLQRRSLLQLRRQTLAELHVSLRHVADPDAPDLLHPATYGSAHYYAWRTTPIDRLPQPCKPCTTCYAMLARLA